MTVQENSNYNDIYIVLMRRTKKKFPGLHGAIGLWVILIVIIVGSVLLAGGVSPKFENKSLEQNTGTGEKFAVIEEPAPTDTRNTLQLKTLKFKKVEEKKEPRCTQTVAIDLLVDTSGSMSWGSKMLELKNALKAFTNPLSDDSVVALHRFHTTPSEVIPFSYYREVKQNMSATIDSLTPGGWTHTRDAFIFIKDKLSQAQSQFPNYQFSLIFFSDGIPESSNPTCTPTGDPPRCFETTQDPTIPPDIAAEIKNSGVRIFSIALLDESDQRFNAELTQLMRNVASSPNDFYFTLDESRLTEIYQQIGTTICQ